ncbi:MAG TPA: DNA primase [Saprospiraceae bacterium]|nr:DNA primase [Saprospiraceae bacterium]HMQ84668.1 DNA primase [Saprospiraceae bacterium]
MIKKETVDEILEKARVEEVIQDFVGLKRRGVNLLGLCPFHHEKTPSFTVSPAKGIYKCFGCGRSGTAVGFIMEHEHLSYPEALHYLARKYGIEIEEIALSREVVEANQLLESQYLINQFAKTFYQEQLFETDRGKSVGLNYFKERGFREEIIRSFGLGYAPAQKDLFTLTAVQHGYQLDLLKKLGLSSEHGRDFFRDRVMFPIHNLSGKVIGFGGRILIKDVKAPKYINTPETDIYHKSKVLYGAFFAKQAIRQQDECILVEGYTDVLSLHQSGIQHVVASSGTSLTVEQIRLIKRFTENVKILYDGDYAGIKAALRGLGLVLEEGLNVKIVLLPEGEDPDSYLQKVGPAVFKEYIANQARDFIMFQADLLKEESKGDPIRKAKLIKEIVETIAKVVDPLKRALYVRECAQLMEVDEPLLVNEINKLVAQKLSKSQLQDTFSAADSPVAPTEHTGQPAIAPAKPLASGDEFQEKDIVRILVTGGNTLFDPEENLTVADYILGNIDDVLEEFDNALYQQIVREYHQAVLQQQSLSQQHFLNHPDEKIRGIAIDMVSFPYEYSENWANRWGLFLQTQKMPDDNFVKDSKEGLMRFKLKKIKKLIDRNAQKIQELSKTHAPELMAHLKLHLQLKSMHDEMATELGTVVM